MNITPKLDLIDQQANNNLMHPLQLLEAGASASQSFEALKFRFLRPIFWVFRLPTPCLPTPRWHP
jgi:hypothetical protein